MTFLTLWIKRNDLIVPHFYSMEHTQSWDCQSTCKIHIVCNVAKTHWQLQMDFAKNHLSLQENWCRKCDWHHGGCYQDTCQLPWLFTGIPLLEPLVMILNQIACKAFWFPCMTSSKKNEAKVVQNQCWGPPKGWWSDKEQSRSALAVDQGNCELDCPQMQTWLQTTSKGENNWQLRRLFF